MRRTARDLIWVLPLTLFTAFGTVFAGAVPEGGWRDRFGRDGAPDAGFPGEGLPPDLLTPELVAAVTIAVLAALLQLFGRVRPGATLLATGALVATYLALGHHDGPIYAVLVVSSFITSWHAPLRTWVRCVGASLLAVLAGMAVRGLTESPSELAAGTLWQATGTVGLTLAAGLFGSLVHSRRQAAGERTRRAATEEQLRTAQELHDGVGHGLAVIAMQSGVALHLLDRDPTAARAALEAIRDTSRESLGALRVELSRLAGDEAPRRPRSGLADLPRLIDRVRAAGVEVAVHDTVSGHVSEDVSEDVGAAVYAIAQEALTNVLRHAGAHRVDLSLTTVRGLLRLSVRDDGTGAGAHHEGMGLTGMRERVTALGGTLTVGGAPVGGPPVGGPPVAPTVGGFEVVAELPLVRP